MKVLTTIFLLFLAGPCFAQKAGILTEPYAGYYNGEVEGPAVINGDIKSYVVGARLGYQSESGWNFGIDYAQGNGDIEVSGSNDLDFNTKDGGIFIGYAFPAYVKVWASYIFKHEAVIKGANLAVDEELDGNGFNVGIGIRGIPFVSVNLTYQERAFDEAAGVSLSGSNTSKLTMLSVSLPYNFPWKP